MEAKSTTFVVGQDYHLGDLLWLTAVIAEYRRHRRPGRVTVSLPDRDISRILENSPVIDELIYRPVGAGVMRGIHGQMRNRSREKAAVAVHDLRMAAIGWSIASQWRRRRPWLYYRDLWLEPRGQWLATFLGLGKMQSYEPAMRLVEKDREEAPKLRKPYIVLAPNTGAYRFPFTASVWRKIKGWENQSWAELARTLHSRGYEVATLAAKDQPSVAGTKPLLGLPIRQAAAVLEGAGALVTGESGLWFIAAALDIPFVVVPWWLPRGVDWPGAMKARAHLVRRSHATVENVLRALDELGVGLP